VTGPGFRNLRRPKHPGLPRLRFGDYTAGDMETSGSSDLMTAPLKSGNKLPRPQSRPEAVIQQILLMVGKLGLRDGDRLPTEIQLADQFGVGRSSVRAGIQGLQMLGLVEVRHGVGAFLTTEPGRWLLRPLEWTAESSPSLFLDLLEGRLLVEVRLAQLAAERRTLTELSAIREAAEHRARARDGEYLETGLAFHLAVARAAHSEVLAYMLSAVTQMYRHVFEQLDRQSKDELVAFRSTQQGGHDELVAAIAASDSIQAGLAMAAHLGEIKDKFDLLRRVSTTV